MTDAGPASVSAGAAAAVTAPGRLDEALRETAESTDRLLAAASRLTEEDVHGPSRLPGWTRGHVLTHLARNADAMVNLVRWAVTGVETPMYPSREVRDAEIEAGAGRPLAVQLEDLAAASDRLASALPDLVGEALGRRVRVGSGPIPGRDLPLGRTRELEIHHVDLDVEYTPGHWPAPFVLATLDRLAPLFRTERDTPVRALAGVVSGRTWEVGAAGPVLRGPESALLAWLTGRSDGDGLVAEGAAGVKGAGTVPAAPRWV